MNLTEIFSIIFIHWFADFVLQTDKQAKGKSTNWSDLLSHTFMYSVTFWGLLSLLNPLFNMSLSFHFSFYFWLITFVCHTITDYFTSRLNSRLWAKGDVHNFFVSIGFDQVLHYVQLFTTYYLLKS
jgi:hypothetical protein